MDVFMDKIIKQNSYYCQDCKDFYSKNSLFFESRYEIETFFYKRNIFDRESEVLSEEGLVEYSYCICPKGHKRLFDIRRVGHY